MTKTYEHCKDCGQTVYEFTCNECSKPIPHGPAITVTAGYGSVTHDGDRADFCSDACHDAWCARPPEERIWQDGNPVMGACDRKDSKAS
jgi:hypothetical protein